MTQAQRILKALQRGAKLTPLDILRRFGCYRASARIADLRAQGHKIKTERHKTRTGAVVARYTLAVVMVMGVVGCVAHPSHVYADRVFTDDGHTYRAYRNDRAAIITHDGGCPHPMHRCRDTVYHYEVQTR